GGGADIDKINGGVGEEIIELLVSLDASQVHLSAGWPEVATDSAPVSSQFLRVARLDGSHLRAPDLLRGQVMNHAHEANADDPDPHHVSYLPDSFTLVS